MTIASRSTVLYIAAKGFGVEDFPGDKVGAERLRAWAPDERIVRGRFRVDVLGEIDIARWRVTMDKDVRATTKSDCITT